MNTSLLGCGRTAVVCIFAVPALASSRHGISAKFDTRESVEITGLIEEVTWRNPHVLFTPTVTNDDGEEALWSAGTLSMAMMRKNTIDRDLLRRARVWKLHNRPFRSGNLTNLWSKISDSIN